MRRAPDVSLTLATRMIAANATTIAPIASGGSCAPPTTATATGRSAANTDVSGESTLIGPMARAE